MSKYCRNCGSEMNDDALFCGACGTKFEEPVVKPQEPFNTIEPEQQPAQPEQPIEQTYGDNFQNVQPQPAPVQPPQPYEQNQFSYEQSVEFSAPPAKKQKTPGKGFGIASMILGIVAVFNCLFLVIMDFSATTVNQIGAYNVERIANFGMAIAIISFGIFICVLAVLSLVFAIVSLIKGYRGASIAGLILSILAIAVCAFSFIFAASLEKPTIRDMMDKNYYSFDSKFEDSLDDWESRFNDIITDD